MDDLAMNVETLWQSLQSFLLDKGLDLVGAIVVVLAGWMIGKWARRTVMKAVKRSPIDDTLASFFGGLAYAGLLIITLIAGAAIMGIPLAPAVAIVGAAGLAVALAFQGTFSNFASGVMLLTFRPFKVGDFVDVAGTKGTVREVGVFFTVMTTPDNVRIIVPNTQIFGETIQNYTANDTRRIDLVMGVDYGDDLSVALKAIQDVLAAEERVLEDPAPQVAVSELGGSSVDFVVRPWVKTEEYWPTRFALTRALKEGIEAAGCSFPFPQRDVHLFQEGGNDGASA